MILEASVQGPAPPVKPGFRYIHLCSPLFAGSPSWVGSMDRQASCLPAGPPAPVVATLKAASDSEQLAGHPLQAALHPPSSATSAAPRAGIPTWTPSRSHCFRPMTLFSLSQVRKVLAGTALEQVQKYRNTIQSESRAPGLPPHRLLIIL